MPLQVTDLILSPASVYVGAYGVTLPAENLAVGAAWPGGWTAVGFTKEALKFGYSFEKRKAKVQQHIGIVRQWKISEEGMLETVLSELTAAALHLAWDGKIATVAAGASQMGKERFSIGGRATLTERTWGFESYYRDEDGDLLPLRVFAWKGVAEAGGELELSNQEETGIPLKISLNTDTTKVEDERFYYMDKFLEPATS